jgi:hypothetical protein
MVGDAVDITRTVHEERKRQDRDDEQADWPAED